MALPVTYDFSGAGPDLAANFTTVTGQTAWNIAGGQGFPQTLGNDCAFYENTETFPDNQYAEISIVTLTGGSADDQCGVGPALCLDTGTNTGYFFYMTAAASNNVFLIRRNSGSSTLLATRTQAFTTTQIARLEKRTVGGNAELVMIYNSVQLGAAITDSSGSKLISGRAGAGYSSTITNVICDNWAAGQASDPPASTQAPRSMQQFRMRRV